MGLRDQYQRLIDKKRAELEECRGQIRAIESYISAMQDAIKLLPRDALERQEPKALRIGSKLSKAEAFLLHKGSPQHINLILAEVGENESKEARIALTGSLSQYARAGKIFTKTGPNEFGLLSFERKASQATEQSLNEDDIPL